MAIVLVSLSGNAQESNSKQKNAPNEKNIDFTAGIIDERGNFKPLSNVTSVIEIWNRMLLDEVNIDAKLDNIYIFKENNEYFLQAGSKSTDYVSTIRLEPSLGALAPSGISCTSKACSSDNGCVPKSDKKSCTSCLLDCSKTVTSVLSHFHFEY